ncbi:MAG: CRISPR-associated helicase Cas3' [Janthinobacterium lividum]
MIIEAAMGDGKTEAALYAADRALSTQLARGFYVALPTQATGNAMFRRVHTYLKGPRHTGHLNLQLVHAGAFLSEEFEDLQQEAKALKALDKAEIYDDTSNPELSAEEEDQAGRVIAESWFTARKRPLLARFGVGTIDQSLLGVLQTRHWFVRLLGLAGKVIIFDEVHAYDIYMSTLLCRLLRWLRVLDCTVILLSATLPALSRQELVTAWNGDPSVIPDAEYPRLTFCPADGPPHAESVADPNPVPKEVVLGWADFDWESVWNRLHADLPDGGGALLLCNTVTRAQDAYAYLASCLEAEGWTVRLFHARTPAGWRQQDEEWVLETFGKTSRLDRKGLKTLLIATQIVEQSLDLDFDWIATEMAPADLLLQRMGRLWRHSNRERNPLAPQFVILCGKDPDDFPVFPDFAELIYERYVLLRSWLALQKRGSSLTLPAAIDPLVQEVYALGEMDSSTARWSVALAESYAAMERQQEEDQNKAQSVSLPGPDEGPDSILELGSDQAHLRKTLWEDDDPRVHETVRAATRLGDPSVGVICTGTDEYGEPLAEMPPGEPNLKTIRKMLRFGLPLSHPIPVFKALIAKAAPTAWKNSSLLRYHRNIEFTRGRTTVAGYDLRLSRAEGLIIKKQGAGTEE